MESRLCATLTVPTGEAHEDFRTLKEEIHREIQEVEKLSRVGQRSLLTSLSKLLGKKKELQDLELTVRSSGRRGGVGEGKVLVQVSLVGDRTLAEGGQGPGASTVDAFPKVGQVPAGCQATAVPLSLWRRANSADSPKAHTPS